MQADLSKNDLSAQYAKWDKLFLEDDEKERSPAITRLEQSSSIKIGSQGWSVVKKKDEGVINYSKWDKFVAEESDGEGEPNAYYEDEIWRQRRDADIANKKFTAPISTKAVDNVTEDGGMGIRVKHDGEAIFVWSQTATEVTIRIGTQAKKAKEIKCINIQFDTKTRHCILHLDDSFSIFRGIFRYDVWCKDDDRPNFTLVDNQTHHADLTDYLDWSLEPAPLQLHKFNKCIRLNLTKRPPTHGITVWWSRLFEPEPTLFYEEELDTTILRQRHSSSKNRVNKFQTAWDQAHAAFLDKVHESKSNQLDISSMNSDENDNV
mmetsp:Transcript_17901/g.26883  ORF Transcript_17901/g.26883 Transcript_17901/m.26883 type:complete len:320 (+) Transcript_17901:52-1011(+)